MTAYKIYNQDHDGEMETGGGGGVTGNKPLYPFQPGDF